MKAASDDHDVITDPREQVLLAELGLVPRGGGVTTNDTLALASLTTIGNGEEGLRFVDKVDAVSV